MKKRWAAADDARDKQEAEDRAYEREKKWARQDAEREAIRRERERFREERALRIEALAVQHKVRDNKWKAEQVRVNFSFYYSFLFYFSFVIVLFFSKNLFISWL